jgi:ubiquinol-cytochrome c reductase cytochrome b subunit
MFAAIALLFLLPWLDKSPVRSIRYRGPLYKFALGVFVVSFIVLGYLGLQPATATYTLMSQIFTVLYFLFFLLMPWYTRIDRTRQPPDRVTYHAH